MVRNNFGVIARLIGATSLSISAQSANAEDRLNLQTIFEATVPVFDEQFSQGLNRYNGKTGLWSTLSPRTANGVFMTNADETVFLDPAAADALLSEIPPTLTATPNGLSIRAVKIPDSARDEVRQRVHANGKGKQADKINYATGRISTVETWAQIYGWFEIEARIPRGKGRWPAFWLNFAGPGWPPEIDIFEAYGEGIATPTPKDHRFNTTVLFDALDSFRKPTHSVDIVNRYDVDPKRSKPRVKKRAGRNVYSFTKHNFANTLDADIYGQINTYAAFWTPEEIIFYFGPDRENLREIYRTPTPDDVHDPQFVIANDQFTARGGFWPADADLNAVLDPENDFFISAIRVRALKPELELSMANGDSAFEPLSSQIQDTVGDDIIAPGDGFDIINLSGGSDEVRIRRGHQSKIISGFDADDVLVVSGFPYDDSKDAHARLTQVGEDVWLSSGADPFWPQSIVFRDALVSDITPEQIVSVWPVGQDIWATRKDLPNKPATDTDNDAVLKAPEVGGWLDDKGKPVQMVGSSGPERYSVTNQETRIEEPAEGGIDTVIASGNLTLPLNVEQGILIGRGGKLTGTSSSDRLVASGNSGELSGLGGDDLYIISEDARNITIQITEKPGHDRLRGFDRMQRLVIAQSLLDQKNEWSVQQMDEGVLITFNAHQSLLIEGTELESLYSLMIPK